MDLIKIAAGIACSILFALFLLIVSTEDADNNRFEKIVELLMEYEGLSSTQEVLDSFPELRAIQLKMNRMAYLKSDIQAISGGPAPNVSRAESLQLQKYRLEILQIRKSIEMELAEIKSRYSEVTAYANQ